MFTLTFYAEDHSVKFSTNTTKHLGHYVYALVDPRDDSIFYVGKASGNNRAFDHLNLYDFR